MKRLQLIGRRLLDLFLMVAEHVVGAAIILTGVWALEEIIAILWRDHDPLLFSRLPVRYIFDGMDLGVIGVFVYHVVRDVILLLGSRENGT